MLFRLLITTLIIKATRVSPLFTCLKLHTSYRVTVVALRINTNTPFVAFLVIVTPSHAKTADEKWLREERWAGFVYWGKVSLGKFLLQKLKISCASITLTKKALKKKERKKKCKE